MQVVLKGTGQANYSFDPHNGFKDLIDLHFEVNLQFVPQNLTRSGNSAVSHQASFTGSIRVYGTAERRSADGLFLDGKSFDRAQQFSGTDSFPVETAFALADGSLASPPYQICTMLGLCRSSDIPPSHCWHPGPSSYCLQLWTRHQSGWKTRSCLDK